VLVRQAGPRSRSDIFAQSFTSQTITASQELCGNKSDGTPICVTGDQLAALLASNGNGSRSAGNQSPSTAQSGPSGASSTPESVTQNSANSASSTPDTDSQDDAGSDQATTSPDRIDAPSIIPTGDASTTATSTAQ